MKDIIVAELDESSRTIRDMDADMIGRIADVLTDVVRNGNTIVFMGNGGSSADAQHIAAEFTGKFLFNRPPMSAISLSSIAPVSAIGNDYSFDEVFRRQVLAHVGKGDAVVGMSTSGNSRNVIEALKSANESGAVTISFTGPGGAMKDMVDHAFIVRSTSTPRIQEGYMVANHIICGMVERNMFGRRAVFIDRDDTIAEDVPYCDDPSKFILFKDVPATIKRLNDAGYLVIVVTNQSGISRGKLSERSLSAVHSKMIAEVEKGGGRIDDVFFCPHLPDDGCRCRKPDIGMGLAAISKHGIDTKASFMVGDSDADMEFGERLGCRTIKIHGGFTFKDAADAILAQGT